MNKKNLKEFSTSLSALVFVVISITGVLMFFHVFDNYTKKLHELIGLGFVLFVILHIISNWTLMKKYFTKKIFILLLVATGLFSSFISISSSNSPKTNQKMITKQILKYTFSSPLDKTLEYLKISTKVANEKLKSKNLLTDQLFSINQIAEKNGVSPSFVYSTIVN